MNSMLFALFIIQHFGCLSIQKFSVTRHIILRFYLNFAFVRFIFYCNEFIFSDKTILDKALEDVGFMQVHREVSHSVMSLC